jgi:hypothetical protein
MDTFKEYVFDIELKAEMRQQAEEYERQRLAEQRARETLLAVRESIRRYRRKKRIKLWIEWMVVGIFCLLAALLILHL